jgi:transposase InsO family protein
MSQKYQFIAAHASEYPVILVCRVLEVARSGYYAWRKQCQSARAQRDQQLSVHIQAIFTDSRRTYARPRVHAELKAQAVRCARKRVARLMRHAQLFARSRRRRVHTTDSHHTDPIAPNLLARTFQTDAPNRIWVADITYLPTREGWLYLAVVLDLFARRVVGWSMQPALDRGLVLAALDHALHRRQPAPGLLHHSDRGSQYASADYQALLAQAQMRSSMSRKGNCWDNAAMESFFATLKAELPLTVFPNHAAARSAVFDYIERFYNRVRLHSTLGYRSPIAYERQHVEQATAA